MNMKPTLWPIALLLLTACSAAPRFDTTDVATQVTPRQAQTDMQTLQSSTVLWGGVLIASDNLKANTQLEILAYPLNNRHKPRTDQPPIGRFLALQPGYLETGDYAPGRLVTVRGQLREIRQGRIGESIYDYPVVIPAQLHLWREAGGSPTTRVNFGVGVIFTN